MKNYKLLLIAVLCLCTTVFAQAQSQITGRVVDQNQQPMIGVTLKVEGSSIGAITNFDGYFNLEVPNLKAHILVSYLGYQTKNVALNGKKNLVIQLKEDAQALQEVVVVGYGVQKKSHLTGAISKFQDATAEDRPIARVDEALQGRIAGVSITKTSSEAGSDPQIRVRGMGSLSASNTPLVVVDGYPIADGLSFVDMNDVESIEVLKDAASAAIYGSRGANGVILVTTKKGKASKPKYSVKLYTGFKSAYELHDMASAQEYVSMLQDEESKGGTGPGTTELSWLAIDNYTDWQKVAIKDVSRIDKAQFSVSGGQDKTQYYLSGSYTNDEGIMVNSNYTKYNMRAKLKTELSKNVTVGININPSYSKKETPASNYTDFVRTYSWLPVKHTEATSAITGEPVGSWAHGRHFKNQDYTDADGNVFTASPWGTSNNNPMCVMENESRYTTDYRLSTDMYIKVDITPNLYFKSSNGFYLKYRVYDVYHNMNAKGDGDANYSLYQNQLMVDLLSENTLNYSLGLGDHHFDMMAGWTINSDSYKYAGINGVGFPTDMVHTINAATSISKEESDGDLATYTTREKEMLLSALGRINYSYKDKYLLSASFRADGSSKFGPENRWGYFPSVSLGWRMEQEKFMKAVPEISRLKLRASWGLSGNNSIPNYAAYDKINSANYTFGTTSTLVSGLANTSSTLGNQTISWEQTSEFNYGFDLSLFDNRIDVSANYYYSKTNSLLFEQPAMAITGYTNFWNNIGKVRNKGIEFEVQTYNIRNKNFEWSTSFNISANKNRLIELGDNQSRILNYGERSEVYIAEINKPSIQYYGYKTDGIWQSAQEIADSGLTFMVGKSPEQGTLKVVDTDGNKIIDANDRQALGDPFPDFTWGMVNSFKIKNFDFSFALQGEQGAKVLNGDGYYSEVKKMDKSFTNDRYISPEYPGDGQTPTFANGSGIGWELTDYLIEDASYVALRNVLIGYKLPKSQVKKMGLSKVRVFASAENLLYLWNSDYKGINPEARSTSSQYSSPLIEGYQRGAFPLQRTISVGLEIGF